MNIAKLTFKLEDRFFYLHIEAWTPYIRNTLKQTTSYWQRVDRNTVRTRHLGAAKFFMYYGDNIAKAVFNRAFNRIYPFRPKMAMPKFLDSHQVDGVKWVLTRKRSYLAHAPGAGKTAQAIISSLLLNAYGQTVFIVPPGLQTNWEREIFKFTKDYVAFPRIGVVGKSSEQKSVSWKADYIIVPDSMLAKSWVYENLRKLRIKLLGVDEASRFKEPTAERSLALYGGSTKKYSYKGLVQRPTRVVFLDGSPMPNRAMELWAPLYALDPEIIDCMNQTDFGFKYCAPKQNERGGWEFRGTSNGDELREKLRRRFMHVVTEDQLNHPERRRSLLFMNEDIRTPQMKSWEQSNLRLFKKKELSEDLSQGEIAQYRLELGLRKAPWAAHYISSRLQNKNESILIFCWHREVANKLVALLKQHLKYKQIAMVIGGTPNDVKEKIFMRFQHNQVRAIVGNIQAMGRGHNLQRADRVIFVEPSWSDEMNKQCEKRASRRGRDQDKFVRCEYIVAPDSMDERVMTSLFNKGRKVKQVIG